MGTIGHAVESICYIERGLKRGIPFISVADLR